MATSVILCSAFLLFFAGSIARSKTAAPAEVVVVEHGEDKDKEDLISVTVIDKEADKEAEDDKDDKRLLAAQNQNSSGGFNSANSTNVTMENLQTQAHACPPGWMHFAERCYGRDKKNLRSWYEAMEWCQARNGWLVYITDDHEHQMILTLIKTTWKDSAIPPTVWITGIKVGGQNDFGPLDGDLLAAGNQTGAMIEWPKKGEEWKPHPQDICFNVFEGRNVTMSLCHTRHPFICESLASSRRDDAIGHDVKEPWKAQVMSDILP